MEPAPPRNSSLPPNPSLGPWTRLRGLVGLTFLCLVGIGVGTAVLDLPLEDPLVLCALMVLGLYLPVFLWIRARLAAEGSGLRAYTGDLPRPRRPGLWAGFVLAFFGLALAEHDLAGAAARALDADLFQAWFLDAAQPPVPYGRPARWLSWIPFVFTLVVVAPLVEELFFRGLLVDVLAARWGQARAWLLSATVFGLLHPPAFLHAILYGLALSAARSLSGSLALPIALHAANNLVPGILAGGTLAVSGQLPASDGEPLFGVAIALLLVVLCLPLPLRIVLQGWRMARARDERAATGP